MREATLSRTEPGLDSDRELKPEQTALLEQILASYGQPDLLDGLLFIDEHKNPDFDLLAQAEEMDVVEVYNETNGAADGEDWQDSPKFDERAGVEVVFSDAALEYLRNKE